MNITKLLQEDPLISKALANTEAIILDYRIEFKGMHRERSKSRAYISLIVKNQEIARSPSLPIITDSEIVKTLLKIESKDLSVYLQERHNNKPAFHGYCFKGEKYHEIFFGIIS